VGRNPYPQSCGDAPSCECVLADIDQGTCGGGLFCSADGDRITVACMLP